MEKLIGSFIWESDYFTLFVLTVVYFCGLYFLIAPLFALICRKLAGAGILQQITQGKISRSRILFEIRHSCISIVVFGFSSLPVIYLFRNGIAAILPDTTVNILIGLVCLNLWNEVHFYIIHRIMHIPFMMRHIHVVHHQSKIPTVWSVYSFHWIEALLLSTVPLTIIPFLPFAPFAVFLYPLTSVLLNYAGHCNYRFGNGNGNSWRYFATGHNRHHVKNARTYGFALNFFDKLFKPDK